jgi:DnaK suppressor protein
MKTEHFKQRLLAEEQELLTRIKRAETSAREGVFDSPHDLGDESVNDELTEEQLKEADTYWEELKQVRDALQRIEDGTFGKCIVDGGPIEEKRLEAIPWTPYCLKHERQNEVSEPPETPSL